jgi:glucosyl-dolichyl phosphate glucuronosyltransferase
MKTVDATILICTYNRAALLGPTLDSIAALRATGRTWDVLVVDNNSTDDTRAVVQQRQAGYPVPLRYLFEGRQGKSYALNTGLSHAAGRIIAFTDDDVRVPDGWLEAALSRWTRGAASPTPAVRSSRCGRVRLPGGSRRLATWAGQLR